MYPVPIKMVAIDVDHTMLTDDHRLLSDVVAAVRGSVEDGLIVVPATARAPRGLQAIASELGIAGPVVCLNGAWTGRMPPVSAESQHQSYPLPASVVSELLWEAETLGLNPCWYTVDGMYAVSQGPLVDRELRATGLVAEIASPSTVDGQQVLKILLLETQPQQASSLTGRFSGLRFVGSGMSLIEVVDSRVSKQAALLKLAAGFNISPSQVAMIGDSENDLEAIQWAGLGIAMGNASRDVLAAADIVVATNEQAGVADALARISAINSEIGDAHR